LCHLLAFSILKVGCILKKAFHIKMLVLLLAVFAVVLLTPSPHSIQNREILDIYSANKVSYEASSYQSGNDLYSGDSFHMDQTLNWDPSIDTFHNAANHMYPWLATILTIIICVMLLMLIIWYGDLALGTSGATTRDE